MSGEDETEDDGYVEPTGAFQPAIHEGIPVSVPGRYARAEYGRLQKVRHPPVDCPFPRYPASMRGFYRCPACGTKAPYIGQRSGRDAGYEVADWWMGTLFSAFAQIINLFSRRPREGSIPDQGTEEDEPTHPRPVECAPGSTG
jgi:hypothetical protein